MRSSHGATIDLAWLSLPLSCNAGWLGRVEALEDTTADVCVYRILASILYLSEYGSYYQTPQRSDELPSWDREEKRKMILQQLAIGLIMIAPVLKWWVKVIKHD